MLTSSSFQAWITAVTVLVIFLLLAKSRLPPYLVMLAGLLVLFSTGVLDADAALSGFSNSGLVTIAVLFVVAAGLRQTGTIALLVRSALGRPRSTRVAQLRLAIPVVTASAFMNNTPLVSMLLPVVSDWCRSARVAPTKVLLPLSYFAILGGLVTLVGTSTNLVVNGMLVERGLPSMGMFDITWVGLPCALVGAAFLLLVGNRLLPNVENSTAGKESPRRYTMEVAIEPKGPLVDKALSASGLRHLPDIVCTQWRRAGELLDLDDKGLLQSGDCLVFEGPLDVILDLSRTPGVTVAKQQTARLAGHPSNRCYVEVVVSRTSPLLARNVRDAGFRDKYGAAVLAIARTGQRLDVPLAEVDFRPGDALLLEAPISFVEQKKDSGEFALVSRVHGEGPATSAQAPIAIAIVLSMIGLVGFEVLSMLEAGALAAAAMLLTRCCSEETARGSLDWSLLLTIGAALGFGQAIEKTGLAMALAQALLSVAGANPWGALIVVYCTTTILTEVVTNNAAAVIVLPIALATATQLGVNYTPFAVAIMLAASSSFATPIGYQTNLMVYVAGGYRFSDFLKIGIPMNLVVGFVAVLLTPLVFSF